MPRILRIINRLNLGGPTFNAAYLTAKLSPEYETMLVSGMRDESEESSEFILESMELKPHFINSMRREINMLDDIRALWEIKDLIRYFKPDIVHTHAAKSGALGRIAAHQLNVPVIVHTFHGHVFHSYFNKVKSNFFINIERKLAGMSTGIIAISDQQKEELSTIYKICNKNKIATIPLGFDLKRFSINNEIYRSTFRKRYQIPDDTITVGIIGRLVSIKNHQLFIRSWSELIKINNLNIHAFIIGDGEIRKNLEVLCSDLGIIFNTPENTNQKATLTFTSWIHEIETALPGLDVVALCSNNEGTPVSLIEAQAAGKPIISTNAGSVKDTVLEGQTALIVPCENQYEFTKGLRQLLSDGKLRKEMSELGPSFAMQNFSLDRLINDVQKYYSQLLDQKTIKGISQIYISKNSSKTLKSEIEGQDNSTFLAKHSRKPRALHIVNRLNLGGITYNVASIAAALRPEFETKIVAGIKDPSEESSEFILRNLGLTPEYIKNMKREINLSKDLSSYYQLLKIIREYKPDIVHTHAAKSGMIGRLAAKRAGVPIILHTYHGHVFHDYFNLVKTQIILIAERYLSSISNGVIAVCESQKKELAIKYKIAPPEKIKIIELGYDLLPFQTNIEMKRVKFRKTYGITDNTIAIGIIGRVVPIKNIKMFIEVMRNLNENYNFNFKGVIVGDGSDRKKLEAYCRQINLPFSSPEIQNNNPTLIFTSWIKDADVAMAGLDIIALTSLNEGTPASLIEAQAAGKPIVATNVGGVADITIPNQTAILVESGDLENFTKSIAQLITDPELRHRLGIKGPSFASQKFHYGRLNEEIKKLYNSLLERQLKHGDS